MTEAITAGRPSDLPLHSGAFARIERAMLRWSCTPVRLRGMALCRIGLGLAGVNFYLSNLKQRNLLWGPNGYIDARMFRVQERILHIHSLYGISSSQTVFQVLFAAGLFIAALFTVFGGRTLTALHAVFLWSIYNRDQRILDGGDNLARILVILLVFVVTDAHFSPAATWRRARLRPRTTTESPTIRCLLHNAAVLLITFQIAILYFTAGAWKFAGALWQNGTAMYYVNRTLDFRFIGMNWLMTNSITVTAITYFAIVANLAFPLGLFTKRLRFLTVALAMMMHVGIIVAMGLTGFGVTMISADLGCLSDEEYEALRSFVDTATRRRKRLAKFREELLLPPPTVEESPEPDLIDASASSGG